MAGIQAMVPARTISSMLLLLPLLLQKSARLLVLRPMLSQAGLQDISKAAQTQALLAKAHTRRQAPPTCVVDMQTMVSPWLQTCSSAGAIT
jgi:hypothetical protein